VTTQNLVYIANQVTVFFATYLDAEAIDGTANHLKSFSGPRMRREIDAHLPETTGAGRWHIALEAVKRIAARDGAKNSA